MNKLQKWLALALSIALLAGAIAFAEVAAPADSAAEAVEPTAAEPTPLPDIADDALLATINGQEVKWADIKKNFDSLISSDGMYYDMNDPANVRMFRTIALEYYMPEVFLAQTAKANGMDQLTQEEIDASNQKADSDWATALENYVKNYFPDLTADSAEQEKADANAAAVAFYNERGYTPESLRADYLKNQVYTRVQDMITKDVTVTPEDVEAEYQQKVSADKAKYENDLDGYIQYNSYVDQMSMYASMQGQPSTMEKAWYKPAGFRAVKHILLNVDEALMSKYKDLQARLEEQNEAAAEPEATEEPAAEATSAESPDPAATPEPTQEPVSQADVDNAKADILASLADKIDEINQKIAEGADFDELIATYAVTADGAATDPGMQSEPYKTTGYEVASQSMDYVPEFVAAAFSVDQIGEVSAPYLSDYGVHIVKYISDVPAGPVVMTEAQRANRLQGLLSEKKTELISAKLKEWKDASTIVYTGVVPSVADLQAEEAAKDESFADEAEVPETAPEVETAPEAAVTAAP